MTPKQQKRIDTAPESAKGILAACFKGTASPRKAIKGQCLECNGFDREAIKNCTSDACPLWAYRPFTGKPNACSPQAPVGSPLDENDQDGDDVAGNGSEA